MTKFKVLQGDNNKEEKKTVFTHFINIHKTIEKTELDVPEQWDNVLHIGQDNDYGDVFKVWHNDSDQFTIFFGEKGNEFD